MKGYMVKGFTAIGAVLFALGLAGSANASSLHQASNGQSGLVTGALPGQVLWNYWETTFGGFPCDDSIPPVTDGCNHGGVGDNIIRLINPNGAANGNLAGAKTQTVCAMIYMFDDDEEMGECCGCPLSSSQLATFSVETNLTSDWAIVSDEEFEGFGALAVVAAAPNAPLCFGKSPACNGGCDPTNVPGYSVTTASNLLGSITHNQRVQAGRVGDSSSIEQITETPLSDDGGGDPTNLIYLQEQCGALVGNSSGGGICNCPVE